MVTDIVSSFLKLNLTKTTTCMRKHLNSGMFHTQKEEVCKLSKYICLSFWQLQPGTPWKSTMWKRSGHGNPPPRPLTTGSIRDQGPRGYTELFPQAPHSQWQCNGDAWQTCPWETQASSRQPATLPFNLTPSPALGVRFALQPDNSTSLPPPCSPFSLSPTFPLAKFLHIEPILASPPLRTQTNTTMSMNIQPWKLSFDQLNI